MKELDRLMTIPTATPAMRQLVTLDGYFQAYEALVKCCKTYKMAYEVLELQYERIFGVRKYDNFASFKAVYWRKQRLKKRICNVKK